MELIFETEVLKDYLVLFFFPPESVEGFPDSSVGKESACNARGLGSIPDLRRSP